MSLIVHAILKPLQSLNALSNGGTSIVTSVNSLLQSVTTTIQSKKEVYLAQLVRAFNPFISNAGFTAIMHRSSFYCKAQKF